MGEAAIESFLRIFLKEIYLLILKDKFILKDKKIKDKILKGHKSGQSHVKGQNRYFSPCRLPRRDK